jgi:hypothetical protein
MDLNRKSALIPLKLLILQSAKLAKGATLSYIVSLRSEVEPLPLWLTIRAFHPIVAVIALSLNRVDSVRTPRAISNCGPAVSRHHHSRIFRASLPNPLAQ